MGWFARFARSAIGAKMLMALSGVFMFGFVLGHMAGNLQIYLGQDAYNSYAAFLKGTPALLWGTRIGLLAAVLVHIATGIRLTQLNRGARPQAYKRKVPLVSTLSSRTMALTGIVVFAFIVYHLLHFTLGVTHPEHFELQEGGRHDVYSMFVLGFQQIPVAVSYIVAMVLLGFHLSHGVTSMFQTLGFNHPKYNGLIRKAGPLFAAIVVLGNVSMPIAVLAGAVTLPTEVATPAEDPQKVKL